MSSGREHAGAHEPLGPSVAPEPTIAVPVRGPVVQAILNHRLRGNFDELVTDTKLARREVHVLQAFYMGRSTRQVADRLSIRPSTVETHVQRILEKTDAESIRDLLFDLLKHVWYHRHPLTLD